MKKIIDKSMVILLIMLNIMSFSTAALADAAKVVSLGANLNEDQKNQIMTLFGVKSDEVVMLEVTNQEERDYLGGLVSDEKIGKRAMSSAYVEILEDGEGISVETHNINWVTKEMYANAMVTAGIENARVVAAAPFNVSGTAALTGIMKAFEEAAGEELPEEAKQTANEEMVTTGELGDDIGQDEAASLVQEIKERIIREKITDPEQIRKIIIDIAAELNINITQEHIDKLANLMERISKLDLSVENVTRQLENINKGLEKVKETIDQNKGFFQKIFDAIKNFFAWLADALRG
ncbi:MAG TPA: DUF1002 domain-containing protein [Clostridiales bacterium]|nr:DUF1002 domain-containing protein [Clostridia bacterium]MDD4679394.1 DUF1002 domain-containing protein [Clostridia bacterium]HCS75391.1 DUF1002 domain-containing protein [Clostridiales bacterium]